MNMYIIYWLTETWSANIKVILTLGVGISVLHDLGELFIHPLSQRKDAATNPVRLENTQNEGD